jgi:peroxiredoxin
MDLGFEVTDLPPAGPVDVGESAPEFTRPLVTDEYWEDRSLSSLLEAGPVLLLFHPMDGAFPATYIWQEVASREWDVRTVGLSVSSPYEHRSFIDRRGGGIELFSDPQNGVAETYGVSRDVDGMAGIAAPRPAAFLIDTDQTVQYAWAAGQEPAFPDYEAIDAAIEQLG